MTCWQISRNDGDPITIEAEEITTRNDGSLWLLRAVDPKPAPLRPVLVLAAGQWRSAHPLPEQTPPEKRFA